MKASFQSLVITLLLGFALVNASPIPQSSTDPSNASHGVVAAAMAARQEPATPGVQTPPALGGLGSLLDSSSDGGLGGLGGGGVGGLTGGAKGPETGTGGLLGGNMIPGLVRRDDSIATYTKRQDTPSTAGIASQECSGSNLESLVCQLSTDSETSLEHLCIDLELDLPACDTFPAPEDASG